MSASVAAAVAGREAPRPPRPPPETPEGLWAWLGLWPRPVNFSVPLTAYRDHLALERTFLAYLRSSLAIAALGVGLLQLFSLTHHDTGFGFTASAKPLASACYLVAILTLVAGARRTWRHQRVLTSGRALVGGPELTLIAGCTLALLILLVGVVLAIDVVKG